MVRGLKSIRFGLLSVLLALHAVGYAEEPSKQERSFRAKGEWHKDILYSDSDSSRIWLQYAYKAWSLMGEPVEHCLVKWSLSESARFNLYNPYTKQIETVAPPRDVLMKARLHFRDIEVSIDSVNKVRCDGGAVGKPGLRGLLGTEIIPAPASFNSPGSPNWNQFFLSSALIGTEQRDGRSYLDESQAKQLFKRLMGQNRNLTFWDVKVIDAQLDISGIKRWFLAEAKQRAEKNQSKSPSTPPSKAAVPGSEKRQSQPASGSNKVSTHSSAAGNNASQPSAFNPLSSAPPGRVTHQATISGASVPFEPSSAQAAASMLLLIDTSGSMGGTRLKEAKHAAIELIKKSVRSNTEVSVLAFSGTCDAPITNHHPFSVDSASLSAFVASLQSGGGTPMSAAVEYANVYLANNRSRQSGSEMILLLADGDDGCKILSPVVDELKSRGILFRHQTVGLELNSGSGAARDLKQLAEQSGGDYAAAAKASQLSQTFENAAIAMGILSLIGSYDVTPSAPSASSNLQHTIWDGFGE